jgi:hypothetical protein
MESTWLELAGRSSLFLFATVVVTLLVAGAMRALSCPAPRAGRLPRTPTLDRLDRFVCEYVGNVVLEEPEAGRGPVDRRADGEPRTLIDQIVGEMERRHVPPSERETFLADLRHAIRSEERLHALDVEAHEAERRFLETQRWALAERFHSIVEDPPPDIVDRIKSGFRPALDGAYWGPDADT